MKKLLFLTLLFPFFAHAAPFVEYKTNIVPVTTNTYYLGTTTPSLNEWKGIYTRDLTVSGTCTGCTSSVSAFPFTSAAYGVSTSTIVGFLGGMFSVGSSTIQDLHATNLTFSALTSGGLAVNSSGLVYKAATTTAGTGLSYSNGTFVNDGVTSIAATSPLVNNLSTGAVQLTCPTCAVFAYPFPANATTSALTLGGLTLTGFSGGLGANGGVVYGAATTTFTGSTGLTYANGNVTCDVATGSVPGCLSAANWTTFNSKQAALGSLTGLVASNGTTIYAAATSTLYAALGNNGGLGLNTSGVVYKYATTTFSTGITYAAGAVTCDTASASIFGCLGTGNFSTFNNKVSSTSLSGASIISYTSSSGVITTAGGTFGAGNYTFPAGLIYVNATGTSIYASASSTIQNFNSASTTVGKFLATATTTFNGKVGQKIASSTGGTAYTVDWDSGNTQKFLLSANSTFDVNATSSHPVDGYFALKICNRATVYTFTYQGSGAYVKPSGGNATTSMPSTANTCINILYQWDSADAFYTTLASTTSKL